MEEPILTITGPLLLISLVAIGVLLFVTILKVLREFSFFAGSTSVIASVCVTALCILGMREFLIGPGVRVILIPYTALALAILLLLFFRWGGQFIRYGRRESLNKTIKKGKYRDKTVNKLREKKASNKIDGKNTNKTITRQFRS